MSVSGISSSNFLTQPPTAWQNHIQQFPKGFQQLSQDLQTGNLRGARPTSPALPQTNNPLSDDPLGQALDQLSQDLRSGNVAAAQKDFATVQQDLQSAGAGHHHHHYHSGVASTSNAIAQEYAQLGQALSGGNLSAAQQAYGLLGQDLPLGQDGSALTPSTSSTSSGFSLTA